MRADRRSVVSTPAAHRLALDASAVATSTRAHHLHDVARLQRSLATADSSLLLAKASVNALSADLVTALFLIPAVAEPTSRAIRLIVVRLVERTQRAALLLLARRGAYHAVEVLRCGPRPRALVGVRLNHALLIGQLSSAAGLARLARAWASPGLREEGLVSAVASKAIGLDWLCARERAFLGPRVFRVGRHGVFSGEHVLHVLALILRGVHVSARLTTLVELLLVGKLYRSRAIEELRSAVGLILLELATLQLPGRPVSD